MAGNVIIWRKKQQCTNIFVDERSKPMEKHLVDFKQIEWVSPAEGIRFKVY
jgi:hypothetical protein